MAVLTRRRCATRNAKCVVRVVAAGLGMMSYSFAQQHDISHPALTPPPIRISVTSTITPGCNRLLTANYLQQDAEAWLRNAGITVSNIHNARLTINNDCVAPPLPHGRTTINQCLELAEPIAAPSTSRATLATSWRTCQSYDCSGSQCQPAVDTGQHTLINRLLSDLQKRNTPNELPRQSGPQTATTAMRAQQSTAEQTHTGANTPTRDNIRPQSVTVPVVVYSTYIIACLIMFLYWQLRKQRA